MHIALYRLFLLSLCTLWFPVCLGARTDTLLTERHIKSVYMAWPDSALRLTAAAEEQGYMPAAQADMLRAMIYENRGMFTLEERYLRWALQASEITQDPRRHLSALYQLTLVLKNLGRYEESIRWAREAMEEARYQDNRRIEAQLLFTMGQVYRSLKRMDTAERYMQQAIDLLDGSNDVHELAFLSTFYGEYASMCYDNDRMNRAIDLSLKRREVIGRMKEMPGPPPGYIDQQYAYLYAKLAMFYQCDGQTDQAAEAAGSYQDTRFSHTPRGCIDLIPYLLETKRYNDILPRLERYNHLFEEVDTVQPAYLILLDYYARAYRGLGDYRRADSYQQRVGTLADSLYVRESDSRAHEYAVLFHTQEQETRLYQSQQRNRLLQVVGIVSLLTVALLGALVRQKQRNVRRLDEKNRIAARQIDELMARQKEWRQTYTALAECQPRQDDNDHSTEDNASLLPRIMQAESRLMEMQLFLNPDIRRDDLLKALHISRPTLSALVRYHHDDSVGSYINRLRVEYAVELLRDQSHYSLDAVATQAGFKSRSTFYAAFQKRFGLTPAQYRKTHEGAD